MRTGDRLHDTIDHQIQMHEKLLLIFSEHSVGSDWIENEVEAAFDKERRDNGRRNVLFPIRIDRAIEVTEVAWAKTIKRTRHISDFSEWTDIGSYRRAFARVLRDLQFDPEASDEIPPFAQADVVDRQKPNLERQPSHASGMRCFADGSTALRLIAVKDRARGDRHLVLAAIALQLAALLQMAMPAMAAGRASPALAPAPCEQRRATLLLAAIGFLKRHLAQTLRPATEAFNVAYR